MRVAVIGSRGLTVDDLGLYLPDETTEIISGGARGVDTSAREYALSHGIRLTEFLPDYGRYGRSAPLRRNITIIDNADIVLAFWDGRSRGDEVRYRQVQRKRRSRQDIYSRQSGEIVPKQEERRRKNMKEEGRSKDYIWQERKRLWCGLPWTFTTYAMSKDRLFVKKGLLTTNEYEVRLYRIVNISISRTLIQRMFGLSTIHVDSSDRDLASFDIINIRHGASIKEMLSETVERERMRNRVSAREILMDADDEDTDGDGIPD